MPLSTEDKKRLARKLEAGEDVPITFGGEDMVTGFGGGETSEDIYASADDHLRTDLPDDRMGGGGTMENLQIDANLIIESLKRRIGELVSNYEAEIALRDAVIEHLQHNHSHTEEAADE